MSKYSKAINKQNIVLDQYIGDMYKYILPKMKVLDVGCSTGYFGKILKNKKDVVVDGIENNRSDAMKAEKQLNSVFIFNLEDSKWPTKMKIASYDMIFFGDVLEHLKSPETTLLKAKKYLKNGGRVIISIPNIAHLSIRLELLEGGFEYEDLGILDRTHLKYFTFESFQRLLNKAGYRVVDYDYTTTIIPKDVIENRLLDIGLETSNKFYNYISKPAALASQYKIIAEPGVVTKKIKEPNKPTKDISQYMKTIDELYAEIHKRDLEIIRLNELTNKNPKNNISVVRHSTNPFKKAKEIIKRAKDS